MTSSRRSWREHPLVQLTLVRYREFYREPEAVFWVFIFPVLLTAGLGLAFRSRPADRTPVALVPRGRRFQPGRAACGRRRAAAIVFNPGAFTHYAHALADALAAYDGVVVEVHLSNPAAREAWRHTSVIAPVATGTIAGFGGAGYRLAVEAVALPAGGALHDRSPSCPPSMSPARIDRLRALFPEAGVDALLVTRLVNIRYLTGLHRIRRAAAGRSRRACCS